MTQAPFDKPTKRAALIEALSMEKAAHAYALSKLEGEIEAVAELDAQLLAAKAEIEGLREALRPFANWSAAYDNFPSAGTDEIFYEDSRGQITVGDLRRARSALKDNTVRCNQCDWHGQERDLVRLVTDEEWIAMMESRP